MKLTSLLLGASLSLAAPAYAQTPPACPFQADELTKVFGTPFKAGKKTDEGVLGSSRWTECRYEGQPAVWVMTVAMGSDWPMVDRFRRPPKTTRTPIANDPDKAQIILGPADTLPLPTLYYERKGIATELSVHGLIHDPATRGSAMRDYQTKLARLRRVP